MTLPMMETWCVRARSWTEDGKPVIDDMRYCVGREVAWAFAAELFERWPDDVILIDLVEDASKDS